MKEGKWISEGEDRWRCSACEHRFIGFDGIDYTFAYICNYCPNCGAKMDFYETRRLVKQDKDIVQCKDCKYWNKHHFVDVYVCSIHNKEGQYPHLLFEMTADDFCSRGELK